MNPLFIWGIRVKYLATGVGIGLLAYPLVKKGLTKLQPKVSDLLEFATAQAEGAMEKGADILAKARENVSQENVETETEKAPKPVRKKSRPTIDA